MQGEVTLERRGEERRGEESLPCLFCGGHHHGGVTAELLTAGHPYAIDRGWGIEYVRKPGSAPTPYRGRVYPEHPNYRPAR